MVSTFVVPLSVLWSVTHGPIPHRFGGVLRLRSGSCSCRESESRTSESRVTFRRQDGKQKRVIPGAVGCFDPQMSSESLDGVIADRRGGPSRTRGATTLSGAGGTTGGHAEGDVGFGAAVASHSFLELVALGRASGVCNASASILVTGRLRSAGRSGTWPCVLPGGFFTSGPVPSFARLR